jgi:DivIVA domain-containing protein
VTSQGQRFRRRALRRGYKVDEVDTFLDRVEATLAGDPPGDAPVSAQEVHDVVFRVRFGGYDEWQVDLHLDRVERQLAELEERTAPYGRDQRMPPPERMGPPDRMGPMDRMGPPDRMGAPPDRMGAGDRLGPPPPMRDDRPPMRDDRLPMRDDRPPMRDDRPPLRDDRPPMRDDRPPMRDDRMMPPVAPPPMTPPMGPPPQMPPRPVSPVPAGPPPGGFDRYDEPTRFGGGFDDGFEPGRHGKSDMTTEIRIPDGGFDTGGYPSAGPAMPPEALRIDQLRRTFQLRRFGSGYDRVQVDRLFEGIVDAMSGRSNVSVTEAELDPAQFSLVPGGYFEAEVDAALKEVRDILARRR